MTLWLSLIILSTIGLDKNSFSSKVIFLTRVNLCIFTVAMFTGKANEDLILSIKNGEEKALLILKKKYFESSRRWMRRNGIKDSQTPKLFSKIIVSVYRDIQLGKVNVHVDLEKYIFNSLNEFLRKEKEFQKARRKEGLKAITDSERESVAACYSILDSSSKQLLSTRYVEKLSFEEIAAKLEFSNPVIAQFEVNKAFHQLQQLAIARLNLSI